MLIRYLLLVMILLSDIKLSLIRSRSFTLWVFRFSLFSCLFIIVLVQSLLLFYFLLHIRQLTHLLLLSHELLLLVLDLLEPWVKLKQLLISKRNLLLHLNSIVTLKIWLNTHRLRKHFLLLTSNTHEKILTFHYLSLLLS